MEQLSAIRESDKRTLCRLAKEFGEDFLNFTKADRIRLYGADENILELFRENLLSYLREKGRMTEVEFGQNGEYNIDVGFFLGIGYFKGFGEEE